MTCKLCQVRGKDWEGDNPRCAFDGVFADNWNCATVNAIRDICFEGQRVMPQGVDYQYCDDQKYATINVYDILDDATAIWVSWYKSRGSTDAMWLLADDSPPRVPTEGELLKVIVWYCAHADCDALKEVADQIRAIDA